MSSHKNNVNQMKEDLSYYFQELSYGIKNTNMKFNGIDELINFSVLDIVTNLFHRKSGVKKERFIDNLESILAGIKRCHNQEKENDEATKA